MKKALQIINRMQNEGLFSKYAIGGGIASLFYIEPIATFDLDIFILLLEEAGSLVSLTPIYEWLSQRGYNPEKEHILIEGIPVQFIPAYNDLVNDAVNNAVEMLYEDEKTFVIRPEYLIAIMLQTNRPKDRDRLFKIWDQADTDEILLRKILVKHKLLAIYEEFRNLNDEPRKEK